MSQKLALAARSFDTVLRHVEHEDDKANRILFAMAFITAAAAALFAAVVGDPDPIATVAGREVNVGTLMFAIFAVFVFVGTLLMLAALGPKFNLLEQWRRTRKSSLLFSEVIGRMPQSLWAEHWASSDPAVLQKEMEVNLVTETHLIAQKAVYKVRMMSVGRSFYKLGIMALAFFLALSFADDLRLGLPLGGLASSLFLLVMGFEAALEPADGEGPILPGFVSKLHHVEKGVFSVLLLGGGIAGLIASAVFTRTGW